MTTKQWIALTSLALLPFISSYAQPNPVAASLSPAASEVVKLSGAGTGEEVVLAFVQNAQGPFNLSADHVLYLKDLGVTSSVVAAMLNHDAAMRAQAPVGAPPPPAAAPVFENPPPAAPAPVAEPASAPPPPAPAAVAVSTPPADVAYFYKDLSPYGTWVDMPGSGWCWQPSAVSVTVGWQPYCHAGHWMNTDAGWFWASDYSWGWAPFHYGRWHQHPTAGWVWFPGREWGPAWVVWRSGGDHCGWAPLPPHADFVAGAGWRYNGVHVSASFDFGLSAGCFSFVSMGHLCDHDLYSRRLPPAQVTTVYHNTTVINNYTVVNNTYVNHGVNVTLVEKASGHRFEKVKVSEGGGGGSLAVRHPLGKPVPVTGLTAVKVDTRGRIPTSLPGSAKITGATLAGSSSLGSSSQGGNKALQGTRIPSSDASTGKTVGIAHPGSSLPGSTKLTTTGNSQGSHTLAGTKGTGGANDTTAIKPGGNPRAGSSLPGSTKFTSTSGTEASGKSSSVSGSSPGSTASNQKLSNLQGTGAKGQGQTDNNPYVSRSRSEDLRGAAGLTSQENRRTTSSSAESKHVSSGSSTSSSKSQSSPQSQNQGGSTKDLKPRNDSGLTR